MDFQEIAKIDDDLKRNEELYKFFDEEKGFLVNQGKLKRLQH